MSFEHNIEARLWYKKKRRKNGKEYFLVSGSTFSETNDVVCDTYKEALEIARKKKAAYIRNFIEEEKEQGYLPLYILEQMERWAVKCECGELLVWEPKQKILEKMGVIA